MPSPSLHRLDAVIDMIHRAEKTIHAVSEKVLAYRDRFPEDHRTEPAVLRAEEAMNKMQEAIDHLEKAASELEDIRL